MPSVLKIVKIRNIRFIANLILNIEATFLDDDVINVTSADNRTQSICILVSPSFYTARLNEYIYDDDPGDSGTSGVRGVTTPDVQPGIDPK